MSLYRACAESLRLMVPALQARRQNGTTDLVVEALLTAAGDLDGMADTAQVRQEGV